MAAGIEWQYSDSSVETWIDLTGGEVLRFKNANNNVNDLSNPLVRPASDTNYSFEKALRINVQDVGGAVELSALRVKLSVTSPGVSGSGPTNVEQGYDFQSSYTQPQQWSGGSGGIGGQMPGNEGLLNLSEVIWTGASGHNLSTDGAGDAVKWKDSEFLYCQLEVGTGVGGTMAWQTIAIYNEV